MTDTLSPNDSQSTTSEAYRTLLTQLMSGQVICQWSAPSLARLLEREDVKNRVNRWASEIGMQLASTSSGAGHYLVYEGFDSNAKAVSRELFTRLMKSLRFYVQTLEMLMNALPPEMTLVPGEELRFHNLLHQVGQSPSLQTQLGNLPSSKRHTAYKEQLDSLFSVLLKEGLLVEANAKHSIYQVTSRIELIQDLIIFIQENEELPEPEIDNPGPRQGQLT